MTRPAATVYRAQDFGQAATGLSRLPREWGFYVTTTAPQPAVRSMADNRLDLLDLMTARTGDRFSRYHFPTADAVIDPERGALFIACDPEPSPEDWSAVCGLIRAVGWDNGADGNCPDDPGEPETDALTGVCTWRLEYVKR